MIDFMKNFILNLLHGKRLEVSAQKIKEHKTVEASLETFTDDPFVSAVIVTGDSYYKITKDPPCYFHYIQTWWHLEGNR